MLYSIYQPWFILNPEIFRRPMIPFVLVLGKSPIRSGASTCHVETESPEMIAQCHLIRDSTAYFRFNKLVEDFQQELNHEPNQIVNRIRDICHSMRQPQDQDRFTSFIATSQELNAPSSLHLQMKDPWLAPVDVFVGSLREDASTVRQMCGNVVPTAPTDVHFSVTSRGLYQECHFKGVQTRPS